MESHVPKQKGPTYYLAKQWLHRFQAARARRTLKGRDPWRGGLRIIAYHRVSADRDELAVRPSAFRAQMKAMLRSGAQPVHLENALHRLAERPSGRYACVTFDDAYHDVLDHAIPVLRQLRIPATIFVPSGIVDGTAKPYWYEKAPLLLSWQELREIVEDDLFTIGAHTRTHPALPMLPEPAARDEIGGCKVDIEAQIGRAVDTFAYPAGIYGEREVRMVREAGYRLAVTVDPGLIGAGDRPQTLPRSFIDRSDNLPMFEAKLSGLLDAPWGRETLLALPDRIRQMLDRRR
jgi:peptidoglycan/xylan/chitin deacetylase (PgdA/CDA1 family)